MHIQSFHRGTAVVVVLLAVVASPPPAAGEDHGVFADTNVASVCLSSFADLSANGVWHRIDGLAYWAIPLAPPDGYYSSADDSSPVALRRTLNDIIDDHLIYPYTHRSEPGDVDHTVDTWDIIALADGHPERPDRVLDIYLNGTFDRQLRGTNQDPRYDREHSWPKSLGFPDNTRRNAAYSDCHHLYAAFRSYNASRSNKPYGEAEEDAERRKITLENLGRGGGLTDEPETSNYSFVDRWQTWIGRRGEVARAMFYMDVRYEGGERDGVGEPDLQLTGEISDISKRDVWEDGGAAFMGLLPTLLSWHTDDPVDDLERRRNAVVFLFQDNRNPFVDHPEWVSLIFGGGGSAPSTEARAWINELHYDNQGADTDEFVEIAGSAGLDLAGWRLVGYNGNGGRAYREIALSGTIPDHHAELGVLAFDFAGLQNGPSDGLALVDARGTIVQLVSYEGRFTATDGPANGVDAEDIQVRETGSTAVGESLQLRGNGSRASDFDWTGPTAATRGVINVGQVFVDES